MTRPLTLVVGLFALTAGLMATGCSSTRAGGAPTSCTDANVQLIQASNYDQSCKTDVDCVGIAEGNACYPCVLICQTGGAINRNALASYQSDISKTIGAGEEVGVQCGCPAEFSPCCVGGTCHADLQCQIGVSPSEDATAPDGGAADADESTSCPANVPCGCSCPTVDEDGGVCVCASFSMPACPASVQTDPSCHSSGSCMNCIGGVAGIECSCSDAGLPGAEGGDHWQCLGTEQACSGGTF